MKNKARWVRTFDPAIENKPNKVRHKISGVCPTLHFPSNNLGTQPRGGITATSPAALLLSCGRTQVDKYWRCWRLQSQQQRTTSTSSTAGRYWSES